MFGFLKKIFTVAAEPDHRGERAGTLGVDELARRLGVGERELRSVTITYDEFEIAKRSGGTRTILAPNPQLKSVQRIILRRLLDSLRAHRWATGFERGNSIVTNALPHLRQDVVIRLDIKDFFGSTKSSRIESYFRRIGWNEQAARLLMELVHLPRLAAARGADQPRLSNLVNYRLDARLDELARRRTLGYSRYADDLTFSGPESMPKQLGSKINYDSFRINDIIHAVKDIVRDEGYVLHTDKKLRIARRHDRQLVTGIVVNDKPNLPRSTRRRLRAIEHRLRTRGQATLTAEQLAGWRALQKMIANEGSSES
jgi:retron-type reverse transcriptase